MKLEPKFPFRNINSASTSTDVDALKFRLVQYDTFYGAQVQQDGSQYLKTLIEMSVRANTILWY